MNQLESLKQFTIIVVDSGDINFIHKYKPQDVTTNPSLILKASQLNSYSSLFENALHYARKNNGPLKKKINNARDKLTINIGKEIIKIIPGFISTEIDAKLSFNTEMCVTAARKLINMYKEDNVDISRILIKIPATWEGIKSAEILEKEGIKCNLTLIFSFTQARACAESNVYLISPFVGRIFDWYIQHKLIKKYTTEEDPGVQSVRKIYTYFKKYQYNTIIMGASFRKIEQIIALAGCDRLTVAPELLEILSKNHSSIKRQLFPTINKEKQPSTLLSESQFRWEHNQNEMAVNKLSEGIRQFTIDQNKLELMISKKL